MTEYMPTPGDRALATPLEVDTLDVVCTTVRGAEAPDHEYITSIDGVVVDRFKRWLGDGRPQTEVWFFDGAPDADRQADNEVVLRTQCHACLATGGDSRLRKEGR